MNSTIQFKTTIPSLLIAFALLCLGLLPKAQAVSPPPDGGYPNFTTAEGTNALKNLSSGAANSALGWYSLFMDTSGSYNTAVGAGTLVLNTGDENTATGTAALLFNTTGVGNTANGVLALFNNTAGGSNTGIGLEALLNNDTGSGNTAIGIDALSNNITGNDNIALGFGAGSNVTSADNVICIGNSGNDVDNSCYIGHIHSRPVALGSALAVFVDATGKLGTSPVDANGKAIGGAQPQAMLNEFVKEHREVERQEATITELKSTVAKQEAAIAQQRKDFEATITELKKGMETLAARSKAQDAKIQKASDQIELRKPGLQTVVANQ